MPAGREDEESLLTQSPLSQQTLGMQDISLRSYVRPGSLRFAARNCAAFMKPSFLRKSSEEPSKKSALSLNKKYATEYLDGVRGVASLIVFILHWSHIEYPSVNSGWGYKNNTSLWLLPFVRLIYSGAAMVSIFFVVSGFVLSHRFIQRMHRREHAELYAGLTSITFRRAIRLFLPALVSSLLAFVCACLGVISVPTSVQGQPFKHGLGAWVEFLDVESNPWDWTADFYGFYNPQLWSVAVEFRGSMVVFLLVAGLARTRTRVRLAVEGLLTVHCFAHKRWDVALFIAGIFIAELEVLFPKKPANSSRRKLVNILLVLTLIIGIFLSGYPRDHNTKTPGYMWTMNVWPYTAYRRRFWLAVGAILIVGPMAFLPSVQAVFLMRPARYLGRVSFALYLVHGLGNKTIGKWLIHLCWDVFGKEEFWPYTVSFVVATAVYFPIILCISDMFWRGVDVPSTEFARWIEKMCASREVGR